jgi:hypothetical protein
MSNRRRLRSLLGSRILRATIAATVVVLAFRQLSERYTCMLPWNAPRYAMEPAMFVIVSAIFFGGFVWLVAEAVWAVSEWAGLPPVAARLAGVAMAVVAYGSIVAVAWAADPAPRSAGGDSYRVVLSLSWAAGYLQASGHYSSAECGY